MPFRLNATEKRAAALLSSVEQVYSSTTQVATRLTRATVEPVVSGGVLRIRLVRRC